MNARDHRVSLHGVMIDTEEPLFFCFRLVQEKEETAVARHSKAGRDQMLSFVPGEYNLLPLDLLREERVRWSRFCNTWCVEPFGRSRHAMPSPCDRNDGSC